MIFFSAVSDRGFMQQSAHCLLCVGKFRGIIWPNTQSGPVCNGTFITFNGLRLPGQHTPPPPLQYVENIRQAQKHTHGPQMQMKASDRLPRSHESGGELL